MARPRVGRIMHSMLVESSESIHADFLGHDSTTCATELPQHVVQSSKAIGIRRVSQIKFAPLARASTIASMTLRC